jgi:SAM-dependent methyltransferase
VVVVSPPRGSALRACPRCHGDLASEAGGLRCGSCDVVYPIRDGIPLLSDGATEKDGDKAAEWNAQHHALPLYLDARSIANEWEELVLPRIGDALEGVTGPVLDVGCGIGRLGKVLAARGSRLDLVGLDFQAELLREARSGYGELVEGDVEALPFKDGTFGAAVLSMTLHHLVRPEHALDEVRRVLQPGGLLVAWDPRELAPLEAVKSIVRRHDDAFTEHHRAFTIDEYRDLLERGAFEVESLRAVDPFGPLVAAGLDLLKAGRLGIAGPLARALVAVDRVVERAGLGLMVLALARAPR